MWPSKHSEKHARSEVSIPTPSGASRTSTASRTSSGPISRRLREHGQSRIDTRPTPRLREAQWRGLHPHANALRTGTIPLTAAIEATFSRRGTQLSAKLPIGLTPEFADDQQKRTQWAAFLSRNRLEAPDLSQVVERIVATYGPRLLESGMR